MNNKSPYDILGVSRYSTQKEIRRCYLELCKKHHPDVSNKSEIDFREITVAYEQLTNSKKNNQTSPGGVNWEKVHQSSIKTQKWTRNSYWAGFTITSLTFLYLSYDKFFQTDQKRTLLPHERNPSPVS